MTPEAPVALRAGLRVRNKSKSDATTAHAATKKGHRWPLFATPRWGNRQRFENWNDRRALALPYFLRSTTRLSRVRKPPRLRTLRNSGS
jgi:hypothetical protein